MNISMEPRVRIEALWALPVVEVFDSMSMLSVRHLPPQLFLITRKSGQIVTSMETCEDGGSLPPALLPLVTALTISPDPRLVFV